MTRLRRPGRLATLAAALIGFAGIANADQITINYTGDNVVFNGLCTDMSCQTYTSYPTGTNAMNWRVADTIIDNLGNGEHWFVFQVLNFYSFSSGNPAGLLAEILWSNGANHSSSAWEVSTDRVNWVAATEYGSNGGANIWTANNGGNPIAGISTSANWIWTDKNFASGGSNNAAYFRTSISVPEPGTLALLGLGLAGIGFSRRRRST